MNKVNGFTKGEWIIKPEAVTGGFLVRIKGWDRGVATATQRDAHPRTGEGVSYQEAESNAHLIATAGTAATKLAEMGYDAAKLIERLPELVDVLNTEGLECALDGFKVE